MLQLARDRRGCCHGVAGRGVLGHCSLVVAAAVNLRLPWQLTERLRLLLLLLIGARRDPWLLWQRGLSNTPARAAAGRAAAAASAVNVSAPPIGAAAAPAICWQRSGARAGAVTLIPALAAAASTQSDTRANARIAPHRRHVRRWRLGGRGPLDGCRGLLDRQPAANGLGWGREGGWGQGEKEMCLLG
jgi:hypothetical protein